MIDFTKEHTYGGHKVLLLKHFSEDTGGRPVLMVWCQGISKEVYADWVPLDGASDLKEVTEYEYFNVLRDLDDIMFVNGSPYKTEKLAKKAMSESAYITTIKVEK